MNFTRANIRTWSIIGSRATFGLTVVELAKENENLMVLTADVSTSAGLERLRHAYPQNYLDVGISEQDMIGIATGLSSEGYNVYTTTFAPFQTMRCCEQIRVNIGYMNTKITMVGLASGIVLGTLGNTHCCFEDISIMRSIPNITVLSPADCTETVKAVLAAYDCPGPVYLRLTGGANNPVVYKEDYDFQIGKAIELKEGSDVSIIATGTMVHPSLKAAEMLEADGISCSVVDMHTIKPLDQLAIDKACGCKLLVTVEEHSVIGGLGSAVSEYKTTLKNTPPQLTIGLPDAYGKAGEYPYLLDKYGLTAEKIAAGIKNKYKEVM